MSSNGGDILTMLSGFASASEICSQQHRWPSQLFLPLVMSEELHRSRYNDNYWTYYCLKAADLQPQLYKCVSQHAQHEGGAMAWRAACRDAAVQYTHAAQELQQPILVHPGRWRAGFVKRHLFGLMGCCITVQALALELNNFRMLYKGAHE